mmetsp:Transcript_87177/g.127517  ORF Transcript_87177/g.127517 Transcript_87177/m.127517 type:complete len:103 (-) Transcript_87177:140-448(-)
MTTNLERGKVVSVIYGPSMGNVGVVIDIVDEKRCLIDGPCGRQIINLKRLELTTIKLEIHNKTTSKDIYYKFLENNILKTWFSTFKGKKTTKENIYRKLYRL